MTDDGRAPQAPGASAPIPGTTDEPSGPPVHAVCPFLLSADGAWRSVSAAREHRCTAVTPPAPLAAEKQRRLCLTAEHAVCATYLAAGEARGAAVRRVEHRRPVARTTPLVLDHGRLAVAMPSITATTGAGQGVLIGLLGLAFAAVLIARIAGGGGGTDGAVVIPLTSASPSAAATDGAVATEATETEPPAASAEPSVEPSPTLVPTEGEATAPAEEATPKPTAKAKTYKIKSGDTLSGIAATYGTTVKAIAKLNKIEDPSKIRVGQVLKIP